MSHDKIAVPKYEMPTPASRGRADLAVGLAIAGFALLVSLRPAYEPDLWWHLAQGRETASGDFVRTNVFSVTHPDYRQTYTPWLYDLAAYGLWTRGGSLAIQLWQALWLALALGATYGAARVRAPASAAAAVILIGLFAIEPRAMPRPHVVSFAGVAGMVWLIERVRADGRAARLAWAVPLVGVWSNLHVECVLGAALAGLFAMTEVVRPSTLTRREAVRALGLATAAAAATLANPYGWGVLQYLAENLMVPASLDIAELRPPYWPSYRGFFVFSTIAAALIAFVRPRRTTIWDVTALGGAAALGLRFIRLTPLVVWAAAPVMAARLAVLVARGVHPRALVITAAAVAVAASPVSVRHLVTDLDAGARAMEPPQLFSRGAMGFIQTEGLDGPLFNSHNLGGYLAWHLYPRARVFQDSRLQAYPPAHAEAILQAAASQPAWDALVSGVDWAVLSRPRPNRLSGAGRFPQADWATVYWDEAVEVLVRRDSSHADLAQRRAYRFLLPDRDPFLIAAGVNGPDGPAIRGEAARQRVENPDGDAGAMVRCLGGDQESCAFVSRRPSR